ncbi:hypothetical protein [uncultured Aureimonas sp.]|uniref:hypothetical protein n=1 Tax=uncultured Aureimonas sp. TaxID=1604662 RepID=UPI0025D5D062|nr:hypothetical protein [uncultured Aureimonas sp.]
MTETARLQAAGPVNADLPTKPLGLLRRLAAVFADDPDVVGFAFAPVTFTWMDGFDGRTRRYTPDLLVERRDGSRTFVSTAGRTVLREDPGLDGRRGHVEADCLSVGATFEVWTEREVTSAVGDGRIVIPAWGAARSAYIAACGLPLTDEVPGIVRTIADRARLRSLVRTPDGWVGCCTLTGVPMAVLPGTLRAAGDGTVTWTPPVRRHRPAPTTAGPAVRRVEVTA